MVLPEVVLVAVVVELVLVVEWYVSVRSIFCWPDLVFFELDDVVPMFFLRDPLDFRCALAVAATAAATISLISSSWRWWCLGVAPPKAANALEPTGPRGDEGGEGECARSG
jgi:hypothetical protein